MVGKSKEIKITCSFCKKEVTKTTSAANESKRKNKPMYCGYECSNKARTQKVKIACKWCKNNFVPQHNIKWREFCCSKCAGLYGGNKNYIEFIERWKAGKEQGGTGKYKTVISGHIKRYLFEKYKNKCSECGWSRINNFTGKIPLDVDHKDGNWLNNKEKNLRLICPNCHALSCNYKSLNKGKGRAKAMKENLT